MFKTKIFEKLLPLVDRGGQSVSGKAPQLLLLLDPERAVRELTSERFLNVENKEVSATLKALNEADVRIPLDRLRPLVESLKDKRHEYPYSYSYVEAIKALATAGAPGAEALAREIMGDKEEVLFSCGAEILLQLNGLPKNLWSRLCDKIEKNGFDELSQPEKNYIYVRELDGEVDNGGFTQYFFNSAGNCANEALEAFRAIGDEHAAKLVAKANSLFGPRSPSQTGTNG
jgi:hypothetical protein